jgi:hypothetical protein
MVNSKFANSQNVTCNINEQNKLINELIIQLELCRAKIDSLEESVKKLEEKIFDSDAIIMYEDIYDEDGEFSETR